MSSSPILGPIVLTGFEVPERITFGGKQRLIVHAMLGGGRVVDVMGGDDAPIRWSGVFSGQNAVERVRALERLRRRGDTVTLTWDAWRFLVIVKDFEAEMTNSSWIPYRIELCLVPDLIASAVDWLTNAVAPTLVFTATSAGALAAGIETSGTALVGGSLASVVAASGQLASYVTQRAYGGSV